MGIDLNDDSLEPERAILAELSDRMRGPKYDQLIGYREKFQAGQMFNVIKDGARFEGLQFFGTGDAMVWSGWSRPLKVGEVVTCIGWEPVYGSDPADETVMQSVVFTGHRVPTNARYVSIWPLSGLWRPFPMEGYLEPFNIPTKENR